MAVADDGLRERVIAGRILRRRVEDNVEKGETRAIIRQAIEQLTVQRAIPRVA